MKTLKITLLLAAILLLLPVKNSAQNQLNWIHDDHVMPSMDAEYVKTAKELADACKKHNIQNTDWLMIRMDNGTYRYVSPIPNMAALDENVFKDLGEKMGKENLKSLFDRMNKCYNRHNSFMVTYMKDLSYMPDGATLTTPTSSFLKYHYLYVTPSSSDKVAENIKAITALYNKKGAKEHVRIYRSGLGCEEEFYVAVISSKDEAEYRKVSDETEKLLGAEGEKAFAEMMKNVARYEVKSGYIKPDLSYIAKK